MGKELGRRAWKWEKIERGTANDGGRAGWGTSSVGEEACGSAGREGQSMETGGGSRTTGRNRPRDQRNILADLVSHFSLLPCSPSSTLSISSPAQTHALCLPPPPRPRYPYHLTTPRTRLSGPCPAAQHLLQSMGMTTRTLSFCTSHASIRPFVVGLTSSIHKKVPP